MFFTFTYFSRCVDPALSLISHRWITPHAAEVATLAKALPIAVLYYA